jgi:uncharacterized membrane protein
LSDEINRLLSYPGQEVLVAKLFSIKPGITIKGRAFKGLRGWAGKPFHPPLTDIPVAAYFVVAIFDVLSYVLGADSLVAHDLYVAASWLLLAGFVVSIPTALTGFWDWLKSTASHTQAWRTANWHMAIMLTVTAVVIVDLLVRPSGADATAEPFPTLLSVLAGGLVSLGATYGGSLVYDYGFNVETSGDHPVWHESEEDVYPGQH